MLVDGNWVIERKLIDSANEVGEFEQDGGWKERKDWNKEEDQRIKPRHEGNWKGFEGPSIKELRIVSYNNDH